MPLWLTSEVIVAITSVLIAFLALGLSLYEGYQNRKHNRLSVLPQLSLEIRYVNSGFSKGLGIWLRNNGVGPAIVTNFQIKIDGQIVPTDDKENGMLNAVTQLGLLDLVAISIFSK